MNLAPMYACRVDRKGAWVAVGSLAAWANRKENEKNKEKLSLKEEEVRALRVENRVLQRKVNGFEAEMARRDTVSEELRGERLRERRADRKRANRAEEVAKGLSAEVESSSAELMTLRDKLKAANLRQAEAESRARGSARKLLTFERLVNPTRETLAGQIGRVTTELQAMQEAYEALRQASDAAEELAKLREQEAAELHAKEMAEQRAKHKEVLVQMREHVGVDARYASTPSVVFTGDASRPTAELNWSKAVTRHVSQVVAGRFASEAGTRAIAKALIKEGGAEVARRLIDTPEFVHVQKEIVKETVQSIKDHWTARLAVHIWDRLELSDSKMEALRHFLSFIYDPASDSYKPIRVWVNPNDDDDYLVMASIASRPARKAEFESLAKQCDIVVGPDGHCQRDAVVMVESMYSRFAAAMRSNYSASRPAQPCSFWMRYYQ